MRVVYIKDSASKGYLRLGAEVDGEVRSYTVSKAEYDSLNSLSKGDNVTRDTLSFIEECDMRYRATRSALGSLSLCDSSKSALYRKLVMKGYDKKISAEVVDYMCALGYIDEDRQIERLVSSLVNQSNLGRSKVVQKLIAKGYKSQSITKVINRLAESGEIDFSAARERLLEKHSEKDENEKKKLLYKNGFINA